MIYQPSVRIGTLCWEKSAGETLFSLLWKIMERNTVYHMDAKNPPACWVVRKKTASLRLKSGARPCNSSLFCDRAIFYLSVKRGTIQSGARPCNSPLFYDWRFFSCLFVGAWSTHSMGESLYWQLIQRLVPRKNSATVPGPEWEPMTGPM